MKKLFYICLFLSSSLVSITACSDEEIKPSTELDNGAGGVQADKGKN